jgi:hypothetical protein
MGVGSQCNNPAAFPGKQTRYPLYRRLGWTQGWSGRVQKISPPPGFDPWTIQPIVSCYTDYTISALKVKIYFYTVLKSLKCIYSTYKCN